jgi:hypothetical protein
MDSAPPPGRRHHSFILCLWQEGSAMPNAPPVWRCSLEEPYSAERRGFRHLDELYAFLVQWTRMTPAPTGAGDE